MRASQLADEFEALVALYVPSEGENAGDLRTLIQKDWRICSHNDYGPLLTAILGAMDVDLDKRYERGIGQDRSLIEQWDTFSRELKYQNRYFPTPALDHDRLTYLLGNLICTLRAGERVFRARVNHDGRPFNPSDLRKPPPEVVGAGRANPEGIPYFYTTSALETALGEVRPQPGDRVTVAEYEAARDLRLIDLRDPYGTFSPFGHEGYDLQENLLRGLPLLEHLGTELSKPINQGAASRLEYLPSQYLCELIKRSGHAGVMYSSALTRGFNYATFDDEWFVYRTCSNRVVDEVDIRTREG